MTPEQLHTAARKHPLPGMLAIAVPPEIERLRSVDDDLRALQIAQHTEQLGAQLLGEKGDVLLYGGRGCAGAFAALARALACLAWTPGGVTVAGMHFCADHQVCRDAEAAVAS